MNDLKKKIGKRMRYIRRMQDISQDSVGFSTGNNSQSYISKIETGKLNFSINTFEKILKILEISPKKFFEEME